MLHNTEDVLSLGLHSYTTIFITESDVISEN